ncbi:MAG: hypothetical protein QXZ24_01055 [Candidatus Jordarchaeales archaeon]
MPPWLAVAKNEYRLMLSGKIRRRLRKPLPFILSFSVVAMGAFLSVVSYHSFIHFRLGSYLRSAMTSPAVLSALHFPLVTDTSLVWTMGSLAGFFSLFIPILAAFARQLEEVEVVSKDILLSSPLKPVHLVIGEFVVNLITIPISLLISTFLLLPVAFSFSLPPQTIILIFATLILTNLTGIWIAVLISTYLFTRELTSRAKAILRALLGGIGIAFALVTLVLTTSTVPTGFWFLPPVWVANVVHFAVTRSNVAIVKIGSAYFFVPLRPDGWTSLALVAVFSAFSFLAGLAYSSRISFTSMIEGKEEKIVVKEENLFYRTVRGMFSYPLGVIVVSQLKEFTRRMDHVAMLASVYVFPLIVFLIGRIMQSEIVDPRIQLVPISSAFLSLACIILPIMIVPYVFIGRKDLLLTIKKTPNGVRFLVYSIFIETLILSVPVSVILALLFYLVMGGVVNIVLLLTITPFAVTISSAIATGVYASRPVFKEGGLGHLVNFLATSIVTEIILFVMIATFMPWIFNLMTVLSMLDIITSKFPQPELIMLGWVLANNVVNLVQVSPEVQLTGYATSVALGLITIYAFLKIGIRRLERYEG